MLCYPVTWTQSGYVSIMPYMEALSAICNSINTICQKFNLVKSDIIVNNRINIPIHNVSTHNYCSLLVRELCLIRDDNLVLDVFDYNEILEAIAHLCTN